MTSRGLHKSWTLMVYMAGDNSLDAEGIPDITEMKKVGSTPDINIVAQLDRAAGHAAKRYFLRKGTKVRTDVVASPGKINTGDPKYLLDFIRWAVQSYPAAHYGLVLWNHGGGWDDTDVYANERFRALRRLATGRIRHALFRTAARRTLARAPRDPETRAILYDDNAKDFLDNLEMKKVLAAAAKLLKRKLDVVGMDACLMSMVEVGYQIHESAAFAVGSEETEPGGGWPYDSILAALAKKPSMSPAEFSAVAVEKYLASYPRESVTYSACDLAKADALATAVSHLAGTLMTSLADPAIKHRILSARTQSQTYEVADNIDLVDFCTLLGAALPVSDIAQRCHDVNQALEKSYVIAQGYRGSSLKDSHGVAIYFPTRAVSPLYAGLDFSKKTGWDGFLKAYLQAVRSR